MLWNNGMLKDALFEAFLNKYFFRLVPVVSCFSVMMHVELLTPVAMEEGLRFAIREGGRTVGSGVVGKIIE